MEYFKAVEKMDYGHTQQDGWVLTDIDSYERSETQESTYHMMALSEVRNRQNYWLPCGGGILTDRLQAPPEVLEMVYILICSYIYKISWSCILRFVCII